MCLAFQTTEPELIAMPTSMKSKAPKQGNQTKPRPGPLDDWEKDWLTYWTKAGTGCYELPKSGLAIKEAVFLTEVRTPDKEFARLEKIHKEFIRGFRELYDLGPAVTVFGSARFKEGHA